MDGELRRTVWKRDAGQCRRCGKQVLDLRDPGEPIIEAVLTLAEVRIYKWAKDCWKCGRPTTVVTYYLEAGRRLTIGEIEKLDYLLLAKYPFVKKQYSRPLEAEVVANTCTQCGAHQSNLYLADEAAALVAGATDLGALVDATIANPLRLADFPVHQPELETHSQSVDDVGHVHHKDGDPRNDDPENLVLLCRACHLHAHSRQAR